MYIVLNVALNGIYCFHMFSLFHIDIDYIISLSINSVHVVTLFNLKKGQGLQID